MIITVLKIKQNKNKTKTKQKNPQEVRSLMEIEITKTRHESNAQTTWLQLDIQFTNDTVTK